MGVRGRELFLSMMLTVCLFAIVLLALIPILQPVAAFDIEKTVVKGGWWDGYKLTGKVRVLWDDATAMYWSEHYGIAEVYGIGFWVGLEVNWVRVWGRVFLNGELVASGDVKEYAGPFDSSVEADLWFSFYLADKAQTRVLCEFFDGYWYYWYEIKYEELTLEF